MKMRALATVLLFIGAAPATLLGWGYTGHRIVNQLALESLPADFPAFARSPESLDRILYLSDVPERWSHALDLTLKHAAAPEHYLDFEQLARAGIATEHIPSFRYDFVALFAGGRMANLDKFPPLESDNTDHVQQWPGFLPWTIVEHYSLLRTGFAVLKAYQQGGGTPVEIASSQAEIVRIMGIMGHYVGDASQPLHTSDYHNGWKGPNPRGFTTDGIHSWIDGGFIGKAGITTASLSSRVRPAPQLIFPARTDGRDPAFVAILDFVVAQNKLVEPLYQLEKDGKLARRTEQQPTPEGRAFFETQLAKGWEFLGSLWLTAWRTSEPDPYLLGVLQRRIIPK